MSPNGDGMPVVLTINAGSSSLKWALFRLEASPVRIATGRIERIGLPDALVNSIDVETGRSEQRTAQVADHAAALALLTDQLARSGRALTVQAIGHRVVHGGDRYGEPALVSPEMLVELQRLSPYDPEHMPAELGLIESLTERYPQVPQVVCFDTGFHRHLPAVARLLAIPRRYERMGVRRYGFHGLSYAYLMEELERVAGREAAHGRVILAHLGNGVSMAAVRDGIGIDTTMGFTPTAGLPMSSRSGDLDPGLFAYLAKTEGMTAEEFHDMVNARSGLLGVSETSSDLRDLLAREAEDERAAEAVALFCYQGKKCIGAYAAALGGLDQLVFSAGIGEHSPVVRERMCKGLDHLGIRLDPAQNEAGAAVISAADSPVVVRVIRTDEESQIARAVCRWLKLETGC
ncbi:MAG: Acetate kinase [Nitrospirae bacterium]|nr:Acetate kinase [Nitrospirota bacterium]MCE7965422.1 acetate/propionate family kinase [Nitrospira sp. NTP2]MCK6493048.1 acetate/propionate family kinase [Nitrospira sp.]MEB2338395.1 acetate/propionate family kinase [Nitrospirales bacterium]QOJ36214.1 MAG: acetate/propionate family kinase [Nitrospira sp.]